MTHRRYWSVGAAVAVGILGLLAPLTVAGQNDTADSWTVNRTTWGDPDLQGIWNSKTTTPLERPARYENREFLTDEEAATLDGNALRASEEGSGASLAPERAERGTAVDVAGAYNSVFSSRGTSVVRTKRTSLVIDPPDGQIPCSDEGLERVADEVAYRKGLSAANLETAVGMAKGPVSRLHAAVYQYV